MKYLLVNYANVGNIFTYQVKRNVLFIEGLNVIFGSFLLLEIMATGLKNYITLFFQSPLYADNVMTIMINVIKFQF